MQLAILLHSIPQRYSLSLRILQIFQKFVDIDQLMWYNKFVMDIEYEKNNLILNDVKDFVLADTFDCGQCFRWNRLPDGAYEGVAMGKALKIKQDGKRIIFYETDLADFENIWFDYFDLGRDYARIRQVLAADEKIAPALEFGRGIRILRQELWECVVSFIISASNNIPRIKKIVECFCMSFGKQIDYMGKIYYSFPAPEEIAHLLPEDLAIIRAGFRDKYIIDAARCFTEDGQMSLENLKKMSVLDSKKVLKRIKGVGDKVADCVLLFGLGKYESFPIDVWMKRIMELFYFDGESCSIETISEFAENHFGRLGGFAQQYLFFYARENKIGVF